MKTLQIIKDEYAADRRFKSWEHFCLVANDNMFIQAIDEIAELFAKNKLMETFNFAKLKISEDATRAFFGKKVLALQFNNLK